MDVSPNKPRTPLVSAFLRRGPDKRGSFFIIKPAFAGFNLSFFAPPYTHFVIFRSMYSHPTQTDSQSDLGIFIYKNATERMAKRFGLRMPLIIQLNLS